jgi:TolA-binding protein
MRTLVLFLLLLTAAPALAQSPEEQLAAASALFDAKKYAEAAQQLDKFLTANPRHVKAGAAALALGRCYTELKQYPKAVPAYEKAVASKDPAVLIVAQLGLGEAAIYSEQYEKAATALDAAVKTQLKPEQGAIAWYWLGQANFQLQKYPASELAYLKVTRDYARADFVDAAHFGAGLAALRQGKTDAARTQLRAVVDRFPNSEDRPQALLILAQMDLEAKRYREARTGFEALLQDPKALDDEGRAAAEEGLINALLELQDYIAAATRLEAILKRLPATDQQRYRANLSLGHCRYRQKQYEQAFTAYVEAAKSTEGAVAGEGHYWAANSALALKRPADAAVQFNKVPERFPKHELAPKAQLRAADALVAAKQLDAASNAYRAVVKNYPQSPEAAEAKKALAELVDAVDDPAQLAAALKNAPPAERARGTLRLARLYLGAKKYAEAVTPLTDILKEKLEPEVAGEAQYLLGIAYEAQSKAAPAATAFAEAVRRSPSATWAADAQTRLAWLYLELKQYPNAEKAANAAVTLKPAVELERQARLALVQALLDQEKWDAALEGCRALLAGSPPPETVATVLYTQAWVSEKRGKSEEALPLWERLAADHPKTEYANEALLRIADARFKAEKYEEARDKYAALLTEAPKSPLAPEARFKLGSSLYNLTKHAEAAAEWDRIAADRNAGDYAPEALYWAGVALEKADKKKDAIDRLSRLVNGYPKHERTANAKVRLAALKAVVQ